METPLFAIGVLAWLYIIYELWAGEAKEKVNDASEGTQFAFKGYGWNPNDPVGQFTH